MYPPGGAGPNDYAAAQADLIQRQVQSEIERIRTEYRNRLDDELSKVRTELHSELRSRVQALLFTLVGIFVAAFALFVAVQAKTANSSMIDFQNSVLGLQKEVLASQNTIRSSVQDATRELDQLTRSLTNVKEEINEKKQTLDSTEKEYKDRLAQLAAAAQKGSPPNPSGQ